MSEVVSFIDYRPAARFDDVPWTEARIEEAATPTGAWTQIDVLTLDPVDSDPTTPQSRNLTTENASDTPDLWYRIIFADADGNTGIPSDPIQNHAADLPTLLAPTVLTTIERLRAHVLRDPADSSEDEKLAMYAEMMSERVTDYCQRQFLPSPASDDDEPVTIVFPYDGDGGIDFSPYEVRSVTDVTLISDNPDGTSRPLTTAEYKLAPRGANKYGTYLTMDLIEPPLPLAWQLQGFRDAGFLWEVHVTGYYGMAVVPKQIELAVLIAVDDVMKNPASWATQQMGGYAVTPQIMDGGFDNSDRGGLPRAAIWACAPFRRRRTIRSVALVSPRPRRQPWYLGSL